MRKLDGVFESITEFSHLYDSFHRAIKGKRFRSQVALYKLNLEENLFLLQERLRDGSYEFGPYRGFYVHEPKYRYIESAYFENRIVHHAIHACIEPWLDPCLYEHSYACREGRGTHRAMLTLKGWLKNKKLKYYLKCDVKKFFPNIDRDVLLSILERKISDERLMALLTKLILTAPGENGIPIGNLTSQLLANVYLNELDQFIKRKLRVKHYVRYMDDFIMLLETKDEVREHIKEINDFLNKKLKLQLSPHKTRMDLTRQGVSFVGYHLKGDSVRLRSKALQSIFQKVKSARHECDIKAPIDFKSKKLKRTKFYASYSSFRGQIALTTYQEVLNSMLLEKLGFD